jgi:hypothetical protein
LLLLLGAFVPGGVQAETLGRCGEGWLESIDGYLVLHVKGEPYEMGFQHGTLLRKHVRENMHRLLYERGETEVVELGPLKMKPRQFIEAIVKTQKPFVPPRYVEEMRGLAAGAKLAFEDVQAGNFIPEMFHCSGFAIMDSATSDGTLLHGRVLDYATDWRLQEHAVLVVAEPQGGVPFVNVTYAGFLGSVTGMNARQISIGEMGGGGLGHWEGVPMALLVREVLQRAENLDQAVAIFRDSPRTCEYYYVIADGKSNRAVGMEASWNQFALVQPGASHPLLPEPVQDAVLLSAGDRYQELVRRVQAGHGDFDAPRALRLMDRPVAMSSNLHNVLFEPRTTRFWVANAAADGRPAAERPYQAFQLSELLRRAPDPSPEVAVADSPPEAEADGRETAENETSETETAENETAGEKGDSPTGFPDPVERDIEGWTVAVDPRLLEDQNEPTAQQAFEALANHLQRIKYILSEERVAELQKLRIWIDFEHPQLRSMQYHPDRGWLLAHGHDPRLVKHVHIPRARQLFQRSMWAKHPYVILHELAHAYHDQVLSFQHPEIIAAYKVAKREGIYDQVLLYTGAKVRHYALSDHKEYFAESTESYLGVNDFYPFVRAELKEHDPRMYALMEQIWGRVP